MKAPIETSHGLATPELQRVSEFSQITDVLRRENPELFDDVRAVLHLNAELERSGLPSDRLQYLRDERAELVTELLENPTESILAEVAVLARSYKGRTLQGTDFDGLTTTQFVTRDPERMKADLHFRIIEFPGGHNKVSIEVPMHDDNFMDEQPFFITIDSKEGLSVQQRTYERGQYQYRELDVASDVGQERLWRFFTHSITATDLLDNRSPQEIETADTQAKQMLIRKIIHG